MTSHLVPTLCPYSIYQQARNTTLEQWFPKSWGYRFPSYASGAPTSPLHPEEVTLDIRYVCTAKLGGILLFGNAVGSLSLPLTHHMPFKYYLLKC